MVLKSTPRRARLMVGAALLAVLASGAGAHAQGVRRVAAPPPAAAADPLAALAHDVSAVFDQDKDPRILLTEEERGVIANRVLHVGEDYRDGWKLTAVAAGSVTLTKDDQTRTVALEGRKQTEQVAAGPAAAVARVSASNADTGGSPRPRSYPARNAAAIAAAISSGNLRAILDAGGSASDMAEAMKAACAQSGRTCMNLKPGSEQLVLGPDGRLALMGDLDAGPGRNMRTVQALPGTEGAPVPDGTQPLPPPPTPPAGAVPVLLPSGGTLFQSPGSSGGGLVSGVPIRAPAGN